MGGACHRFFDVVDLVNQLGTGSRLPWAHGRLPLPDIEDFPKRVGDPRIAQVRSC
jgi:hypothetical protein